MENKKPISEKWTKRKLGELQENWPKTSTGEYEEPVLLTKCSAKNMDDSILVNMLESYEIPCLKQYPNDGSLGNVILGMSGAGVEIYVPASKFMEAKDLLEGEQS